jgi:hypothetical protein
MADRLRDRIRRQTTGPSDRAKRARNAVNAVTVNSITTFPSKTISVNELIVTEIVTEIEPGIEMPVTELLEALEFERLLYRSPYFLYIDRRASLSLTN